MKPSTSVWEVPMSFAVNTSNSRGVLHPICTLIHPISMHKICPVALVSVSRLAQAHSGTLSTDFLVGQICQLRLLLNQSAKKFPAGVNLDTLRT